MLETNDRSAAGTDIFWGELAPCEHLVQLYEHDDIFLDTLEGFVYGGLRAGDAVIVIATARHARDLNDRLKARGVDIGSERKKGNFTLLNAEDTLHSFISDDGWPNDDDFYKVVKKILQKARGDGRRVRAFGEMVAVLWEQGHNAATVRLEHLWHKLCQEEEGFSLFCAYPRAGFTEFALKSLQDICAIHSRVVN